MKWNKFRLRTTTQAEDIVSSILMDLGIQGIEIEDKIPLTAREKEQMFVDIMPEGEADDGIAYVSFYLEEDQDKEEMLASVRNELEEMRTFMEMGDLEIEESQTEDVDWVNNWKKYFHQFTVDDVLIIPSWEDVEPKDKDKMIIHIDPGTALYPTDQKVYDTGSTDPGRGMRKWNPRDAGIKIRGRTFVGNRSGSMRH